MTQQTLPNMVPVDEPPAHIRGDRRVSAMAIVGYCMARPGQWFRVDVDYSQPSKLANLVMRNDGVEAMTRNGQVYVRATGGAA